MLCMQGKGFFNFAWTKEVKICTVTRFVKLYSPALNGKVHNNFCNKEGSTLLKPVQGIVYLVTGRTVSWYVIKSVRNVSAGFQTKKILYVSSFD
jgi:hypothetical protein